MTQTLPWTPFPAFVSGPPTLPGTTGRVAYDITTTPFTAYVFQGGAWHLAGQAGSSFVVPGKANVALTNAQLTHLHSAPVTLVAAPGAGKIIIPHFISGKLIFGTAAFTAAVPNVFWGATTNKSLIGTQATLQTWMRAAASAIFVNWAGAGGIQEDVIANIENQGIVLADGTGDDASGDSTAQMVLSYDIVTL